MAAAPTAEAAPAAPLDIREGPMAAALSALARQAQIELLFDPKLVRGLTARPLRGQFSGESALARLLAGSGVGYRATPDGAFVLIAVPVPVARPAEPGDGAVAELLVVGRRTQNVDIRRTENDIQPYQVFGRGEIETAGRDTVEEFLRARATASTEPGPLALYGGENRSAINLRGLGETSTLVLVDGRRMPFVPTQISDLHQADINGVPPGAIERIEVLTTTAGGIYGPGAVGGVVNVVLRRDYRGADLTAYAGGSDRGDSGQFRIEGRLGFTPDHGDTDVMLFVAHSEAAPLRVGQRDYVERAGRLRFANDPASYVTAIPIRNGVSVVSQNGDLTLDPEHGGAALGAAFTYLPLGFAGTGAEADALLLANAGQLPLELSGGVAGKRAYIQTVPRATSALVNVRRRIGPRVEVFFDGLYTRNAGRWEGPTFEPTFDLTASDPGNPFSQDVTVTLPVDALGGATTYRFETSRWTTGAIVDLPHGWRASADYTWAQSLAATGSQSLASLGAVGRGVPGPNGEPPVALFGDWAAVVAALPSYVSLVERSSRLQADLRVASLRLSGPLLRLPGGPLTATLLAEDRQDHDQSQLTAPRTQEVQSGYVELRAPLVASDADNLLLRGLEVQLAVRHDASIQRGSTWLYNLNAIGERFSVRHDATTFTAGARVLPTPRLMLRASIATGERLPSLFELQGISSASRFVVTAAQDPRRAGRPLGSEGPWTLLSGGSTRIGSAEARSFTVGAVINPEGRGPRLSLDYSRIVVSREPAPFPLTAAQLLASETQYPDRVVRAPVTAADMADGFTVGRVISLDTSNVNSGRTVVEAVDVQFDWLLTTDEIGDFRPYGALTWEPTFRTRRSPSAPTINRVGYFDGPLEWRANAGVEWIREPFRADLNVQYYGSSRVTYAESSASTNAQLVRYQGDDRIPAQAYVDLSLRRRFTAPFGAGPLRALEARISIQNLLDKSPPVVATPPYLGFSEYGDPRRRRVAAALSAQF